MQMTRIRLLFLLFSISINCFGQTDSQSNQLDSIFTMLCAQNQFNGSVLIAEKGKVIFKKGYGFSDETTKQRNNANTIYDLESCSKQFTAAAIVLLKRQGKLNYEDKIAKYLPELSFWDKVTIYDLLRHTSGLPYYMSDMAMDWDKTKIATNEDIVHYYRARRDTLQFEPQSRHQYNNTNYAFLADIIERVSGMKYADFLSKNIFEPLKMRNTFVYNRRAHPRKVKNHATGYVWAKNSFTKVTPEDPQYNDSSFYFFDGVVGEAKVNSTVGDVFLWITALKNNTFFTQTEFDEMTAITKTSAGKNIPYGFGLDLSKGENKFSFGHTGSGDGYVSLISHTMIKDRTIIILENFRMGVFPFENINQILDNQPIVGKYKKRIALPETDIRKYAGVYTDEENKKIVHIITYQEGRLFYNTENEKWDMRFFPVSTNEFQSLRPNGADGVISFTTLADGATKLEMQQSGKVIGNGVRPKQE